MMDAMMKPTGNEGAPSLMSQMVESWSCNAAGRIPAGRGGVNCEFSDGVAGGVAFDGAVHDNVEIQIY